MVKFLVPNLILWDLSELDGFGTSLLAYMLLVFGSDCELFFANSSVLLMVSGMFVKGPG